MLAGMLGDTEQPNGSEKASSLGGLISRVLGLKDSAINDASSLAAMYDAEAGDERERAGDLSKKVMYLEGEVARLRFALGGSLPRFFLGQGKEGSDSKQGCQDEVAIQDHGFNTNTDGPFLPSRFARGPFARELRINLRWKPEAISVLRRARWASLPRARLDSGPSGSERRVPSTAWFRSSGSGVIPGERPSS